MVAKKSTAKKPVKKPVGKKTTKKVAAKRTTKKAAAEMKSFKLYKETKPFTTFRVTRQTAYWIVLLVFIVITQLWILKVQMDLATLTAELLAN